MSVEPLHIHILTSRYDVIDPRFGRSAQPMLELDMGCGKGGFALALAARFPERLVLAADVMLGRLRKAARKGARQGLQNLELLRASNLELAGFQLPDACIDRLHVLCPDPWPKKRHGARRLLSSDFLSRLARVMKPGAVLHLATDDGEYLEIIKDTVAALPFFEPDLEKAGIADILDIQTDFEKRWLEMGRTVPHLAYTRKHAC
jgi:tRNA (guanine-N7-)-methyltransferase